MPLYTYKAEDHDGAACAGMVAEKSAGRAQFHLGERGLRVTAIEKRERPKGPLHPRKPFPWQMLEALNRQLLAAAEHGLPLGDGLDALARESKSRRCRRVIRALRAELDADGTLLETLDLYPENFAPIYAKAVQAAEQTSDLPRVLEQLVAFSSRMAEKEQDARRRLRRLVLCLLMLPLIGVLLRGIAVTLTLMPMLLTLHAALTLPFLVVRGFLSVIGGIRGFAALLAFLFGLFCIGELLKRNDSVLWWDSSRPRAFFYGRLHVAGIMEHLCRCLALLVDAKVPPAEALHLASGAVGSPILRKATLDTSMVALGKTSIAETLRTAGRFGLAFCWMVEQGEKHGNTVELLRRLAERYRRRSWRPLRPHWLATVTASLVLVLYGTILFVVGVMAGLD